MALAIQLVSYLLWFPLKILGIQALLRTGVRRYPLMFAYMVVTFLFAAVQTPIALGFYHSDPNTGAFFRRLHYWGELINYALILIIVLNLVHRASERVRGRRTYRLGLALAGVLTIGLSFVLRYDATLPAGIWMTPWTRDLKFCAAILDLALWGLLVSSRDRDQRLLLLTGGMGIMFAGEAIGAALQSIAIPRRSYTLYYGGHLFQVLASALFLYVWWQAFRRDVGGSGAKATVLRASAGTD